MNGLIALLKCAAQIEKLWKARRREFVWNSKLFLVSATMKKFIINGVQKMMYDPMMIAKVCAIRTSELFGQSMLTCGGSREDFWDRRLELPELNEALGRYACFWIWKVFKMLLTHSFLHKVLNHLPNQLAINKTVEKNHPQTSEASEETTKEDKVMLHHSCNNANIFIVLFAVPSEYRKRSNRKR